MANQVTVNSGTGNITVTTSRAVIGTVANVPTANFANFAGEANTANSATIAASANSVALANVTGAGNIASINLDGNASTVLRGDGTFSGIPDATNANFANFAGTAFAVDGANVSGAVAFATTANAVAGANVSGEVANANFATNAGTANVANTANAVDVANVTGIGNIATVNLDGNASTILYGNGVFAGAPDTANANFANFAGNAFSVDGANVSGAVAFATTANAVAGANVSGEVGFAAVANSVALANVSSAGNIASINLDGNVANVLRGDGTFSADANSSYGDSNVVSLLGSFGSNTISTTGLITGDGGGLSNVIGANISGEVANANFATNAGTANTANTANSVDGANVVGEVANAAFATSAGSANSATTATNIANGNSSVGFTGPDGDVQITIDGSTKSYFTPNGLVLEGTGNTSPNLAQLDIVNGYVNWTLDNVNLSGAAPLNYAIYDDSSGFIQPFNYLRLRGDRNTAVNIQSGDTIFNERAQAYYQAGAEFPQKTVLSRSVTVNTVDANTGDVVSNHTYSGYNDGNVDLDTLNMGFAQVNMSNSLNVDSDLIVGSANNKANISVIPDAITFDGRLYTKLNKFNPDYGNFIFNSAELHTLENYENGPGFGRIKEDYYYVEDTGNSAVAQLGFQSWTSAGNIGSGNARVPGTASIFVASTQTNLTTSSPGTMSSFQVGGQGGLGIVDGAGGTNFAFNVFHYNEGGLLFRRRRGNGDARSNVAASDLTSAITWDAAGVGSFGNGAPNPGSFINSNVAYISGKVDSTYTGSQGEQVPLGVELSVVDSSGNAIVHSFYANGQVEFNGLTIGNVAGATLDGSNSNVLYGNGTFAPVSAGSADAISNGNSSVTFTGVDGNINIVIDSVQTVGITPNAVDITGNITANNLGNIASINLDGDGSNVLYGNGVFAAAPTAGSADSISNGNSSVTFTGVDGDVNIVIDNIQTFNVTPNAVDITGNITANNLGNIASINLDGDSSNVLRGDGTFASAPIGTVIENGNSSVSFTGPSGDIRFKVDNNNRVEVRPDGLALTGANTGASDVARLDIINGGLLWTLDNTQFFGGTPFGMNQFNDSGSLAYGLNFYRARGSFNSQSDVQSGDQGYSRTTQFRYNGGTVTAGNELVLANTFTGGGDVAITHAFSADSDTANSKFIVTFGQAIFSNDLTANGNITGSNVTATQYVVLANDTAANIANLTGVPGAMISVSDQDDQPAYWSNTDTVWKYVSNRANV